MLTVVRQPAKEEKKASKKKDAMVSGGARHSTWRYNEEFAHKYGINGRPSNVFLDYEPPSARMRLRDIDGKELRQNAEKSILINEYFIDLFTPAWGVVYDMFAGTASMAVACMKNQRFYVGTEKEQTVVESAQQRIGRTWAAADRREMVAELPGIPRALAEQVST